MKYQGGKHRLAKKLIPLMMPHRQSRAWVEPFVGGGNVIQHVTGERIGGDAFGPTIEALRIIRDHAHELPRNNKEFTQEHYQMCKRGEPNEWSWMAPFALFAYAHGAVYRAGWSHDSRGSDFVGEAYRAAQKQSAKLQGVELIHACYDQLDIPPQSVIYCDPPYANTSGYKTGAFDHVAFWQWARNKHSEGHIVFVSEYSAPTDFVSVWQMERHQDLRSKRMPRATEHLFVPRDADYATGVQMRLLTAA